MIQKEAPWAYFYIIGDLGGILICAGTQINSWGVASKYPKQALDIYSAPTTSEPYGFSSRLRISEKQTRPYGSFFIFLVISAGFEPAIAWMRTRSPGPLDDETSHNKYGPKGG